MLFRSILLRSHKIGPRSVVLSYFTYLGPLHEEQKPSTTSRHLTRSWAAFITPFQQVSFCAISVSVLRLQLLRGRPLVPFPCGFHVRAWRVVLFGGILKVWPIQDHFLLRISLETGSCPVLTHNTSFLSLSDHLIPNLIPNILLRHVLRNVCSRLRTFDVHTFLSSLRIGRHGRHLGDVKLHQHTHTPFSAL